MVGLPSQIRKPQWPSDAIMVVAARRGTEIRRDQMVERTIETCRDCGTDVCVTVSTINTATSSPHRHGRPVEFFCIECCIKYDRKSVAHLIDDRPGDD